MDKFVTRTATLFNNVKTMWTSTDQHSIRRSVVVVSGCLFCFVLFLTRVCLHRVCVRVHIHVKISAICSFAQHYSLIFKRCRFNVVINSPLKYKYFQQWDYTF